MPSGTQGQVPWETDPQTVGEMKITESHDRATPMHARTHAGRQAHTGYPPKISGKTIRPLVLRGKKLRMNVESVYQGSPSGIHGSFYL